MGRKRSLFIFVTLLGFASQVNAQLAVAVPDVEITPTSATLGNPPPAQTFHAQPEVSALTPVSSGTPVPRLAEWNGNAWVTVDAGSITSDHVHVLVHGWEPGQLSWVDGQMAAGLSTNIWDDNNPGVFGDFTTLAAAIANDDPGSAVVAFSWIDKSATAANTINLIADGANAKQSEFNTNVSSQLLATYLEDALAPHYSGKIQLFGHSHGARVATLAAQQLVNALVPVDQVTLADSPEGVFPWIGGANNDLSPNLKELIHTAPDPVFIDNYISYFGAPYRNASDPDLQNIVDVQLDPGISSIDPVTNIGDAHIYPVQWYATATNRPGSQDGLAWSPTVGSAYQTLDPSYLQNWAFAAYNSRFETRLASLTSDAVLNAAPYPGVFPESVPFPGVLSASALKTSGGSVAPNISGSPSVYTRSVTPQQSTLSIGNVASNDNGITLTENGNAIWFGRFTSISGDESLNFDYQFSSLGSGAQLGIWVDDELRFLITGALSDTSLMSSNFDISDLTAGEHTLDLGLYTYASGNAIVTINNFSIDNLPEPCAGAFFLFVAVAGLSRWQKRTR